MTVRLNEFGGILVYPVTSKITGETLHVDDRTFDPEIHVAPVAADPSAVPEPSGGEAVADATPKPAKAKGKK